MHLALCMPALPPQHFYFLVCLRLSLGHVLLVNVVVCAWRNDSDMGSRALP